MNKQASLIKHKINNSHTYVINDLYCARIVKYNSSKMVEWLKFDYNTTPVKEFAIFYKTADKHDNPIYTHIKSGTPLTRVCYSFPGSYAIDSVAPFKNQMRDLMQAENFTPNTKLSKNIIEHIESEFNLTINPDQKQEELFY